MELSQVFPFAQLSDSIKRLKIQFGFKNNYQVFTTNYEPKFEFQNYNQIIKPGKIMVFKRINKGSDIIICVNTNKGKVFIIIEIKWIETDTYVEKFRELSNLKQQKIVTIHDITESITKIQKPYDGQSLFQQNLATSTCFEQYLQNSKDQQSSNYIYYVFTVKECADLNFESIKKRNQCSGLMFSNGLKNFESLCGVLADCITSCWLASLKIKSENI